MNRTLVIGGGGYLGTELVARLAADGRPTRVLDLVPGRVDDHGGGVEFLVGDINDPDMIARAAKGAELVMVVAGPIGNRACGFATSSDLVCPRALPAVTEALASSSARVLFLVPGHGCGDSGLGDVRRLLGRLDSGTVLRLGCLFGWSRRMRFDLPLNYLVACAVTDGKIEIAAGSAVRPYIHLADAIEASLLVAALGGTVGRVIDIAWEDFAVTDIELGWLIRDILGCQVTVVPGGQQEPCPMSFSELEELGFRPRHSPGDGVKEIARHLESAGESP